MMNSTSMQYEKQVEHTLPMLHIKNRGYRYSILCLALLFALTACTSDENQAPTEAPVRAVMYEVARAYKESGARLFSGVARSATEARISFKVPGTLTKFPVKVGDSLEKGQLIAAIDSKDFQLKVNEAKAGFRTAESKLRAAKSNYSRVQRLYEHRNASKSDLDTARTAFEEANAGVSAVSQQLTLAKRQLSYTKIYSPNKCRVAATLAQNSENISAGQPLVLLNCGDDIEVEIAVPEQYITAISETSNASVTFTSILDSDFSGTITEIGVASTGRLTTFPVIVRVENNGQILSGMAATVSIQFGEDLVIPAIYISPNIVQEDQHGRFVYVVRPDNGIYKVNRRTVITGQIDSRGISITSGLKEGEMVVSAGIRHMRDGLNVKLFKK
ncbi:MAG: efflux RND transporter periplasmic adaptor subunit [Gammaproteobacteria bacterium]|nr:MAG: efflux RND transporter periplasmic adaptor subunit [Gammaproteobacteria bacterium]